MQDVIFTFFYLALVFTMMRRTDSVSTLKETECKDNGGKSSYVTEPEGYILSPNYPGTYPRHVRCQLIIKQHQGQQIQIDMLYYRLRPEKRRNNYTSCTDYLQLDGSRILGMNPFKTRCGRIDPFSEIIDSNEITVRFTSDSQAVSSDSGIYYFRFQYKAVGCISLKKTASVFVFNETKKGNMRKVYIACHGWNGTILHYTLECHGYRWQDPLTGVFLLGPHVTSIGCYRNVSRLWYPINTAKHTNQNRWLRNVILPVAVASVALAVILIIVVLSITRYRRRKKSTTLRVCPSLQEIDEAIDKEVYKRHNYDDDDEEEWDVYFYDGEEANDDQPRRDTNHQEKNVPNGEIYDQDPHTKPYINIGDLNDKLYMNAGILNRAAHK